MTKLLLILITVVLQPTLAFAAKPNCEGYAEAKRTVDAFYWHARNSSSSLQEAMFEMQKEPRGSACWLVRDLEKVNRQRLSATQASVSKPLWALRGLRFLTNCTEFRGALKSRQVVDPQDIRWQLLFSNGVEHVPFFRTWMTRDVVVIAPIDVQEQVIAAWQDWYSHKSPEFIYKPCERVDAWY